MEEIGNLRLSRKTSQTPKREQHQPEGSTKGGAQRSPPKDNKAEEARKLTPKQLQMELKNFKDKGSPQPQALLTEIGIWEIFKEEDHEGCATDFLEAGVQFATSIACSGGTPGFLIEAVMDLMKDKFTEKGTSRIIGYGLRKMKWDQDREVPLVKKLSCNVLTFAIITAAGTNPFTAGASAIVGAAFALYIYLDRRDAKKYEKMQAEIAEHMVATYSRIKKASQEKLDVKNQNEIERLLLSSSKQDWEDDYGYVVATYWRGAARPFEIIHDYDLKELRDLCRDASKLITYRQAQIWLAHREQIKSAGETYWAGQGIDDKLKKALDEAVADSLMEQNAEAQITDGDYLALLPEIHTGTASKDLHFSQNDKAVKDSQGVTKSLAFSRK